jgi:chromosome segregation ATPase
MSDRTDRLTGWEKDSMVESLHSDVSRLNGEVDALQAELTRLREEMTTIVNREQGIVADRMAFREAYRQARTKLSETAQELTRLRGLIRALPQAIELYEQASTQSHSGHWDRTGQHGAGCEECQRAYDVKQKAREGVAALLREAQR